MSLAYSRQFEEIANLVAEAIEVVRGSGVEDAEYRAEKLSKALERLEKRDPLRVVFIGEFSSGKSSIISALTGAEIKISADVATDRVSEYRWKGLVLVDTPGIHSDSDATDHDKISKEATVGADLVLFVITNELFNPRLADHLKYILDDLGLANKTCIIVNKMDRETNPPENIVAEVAKVLGDHQEVPILLCSAGKALRARSTDKEHLRERFERESGFEQMIEELDRFIGEREAIGRLQAPLSLVAHTLDAVEESLLSPEEALDMDSLRERKEVLESLRRSLNETKREARQRVLSLAAEYGNRAADESVYDGATEESIKESVDRIASEMLLGIGEVVNGVLREVETSFGDAESKVESLESVFKVKPGEFSLEGGDLLAGGDKFAILLKGLKGTMPELKAYLEGLASDLKACRNIYYKIGKKLGKKFKPWDAVKGGERLAEGISKASKVAPFITIALDIFINYREEKAEMEKEKALREAKMVVRRQFREIGEKIWEDIDENLSDIDQQTVGKMEKELEEERKQILMKQKGHEELKQRIAKLRTRCRILAEELNAA